MAINLGKKKDTGNKYPTKTSINFISDKQEKVDRTALILFPVFLILLALFVKFLVLDPMARLEAAKREYSQFETQLNEVKAQLKDYDQISKEYNEIRGDFMNDKERSYLDRSEILDMIKDDVFPYVELQSIQVSDNIIRIASGNTKLDTVSKIVGILLEDTRNADVKVKTAKSDSKVNDDVTANMEIAFAGVNK